MLGLKLIHVSNPSNGRQSTCPTEDKVLTSQGNTVNADALLSQLWIYGMGK